MSGEKNLDTLLSTMQPELAETEFVFLSLPESNLVDCIVLEPIATIVEKEGLTVVITKQMAIKHHLNYDGVFSCITLNVHSSLEAVGLTAAIAGRLAKHGISANVIAGYYHDHIFVPHNQREKALMFLTDFE